MPMPETKRTRIVRGLYTIAALLLVAEWASVMTASDEALWEVASRSAIARSRREIEATRNLYDPNTVPSDADLKRALAGPRDAVIADARAQSRRDLPVELLRDALGIGLVIIVMIGVDAGHRGLGRAAVASAILLALLGALRAYSAWESFGSNGAAVLRTLLVLRSVAFAVLALGCALTLLTPLAARPHLSST